MVTSNKKPILRQIEKVLQDTYVKNVDISDLAHHDAENKRKTILSRALSAMALNHLANIETDQCGRYVTDQPKDNGIDAIGFDPIARVIYFVQAKYFSDGNGGVSTEGVLKLIKGFEDVIDDDVSNFGSKFLSLETEIRQAVDAAGVKYVLTYVHSGDSDINDDQRSAFDKICLSFNKTLNPDADPILSWKVIKLPDIYEWVRKQTAEGPIDLSVDLLEWGEVAEPYAVYGQVKGTDISDWWAKHGRRLVEKNIRSFLGGDTPVNRGLINTIKVRPGDFWHFNNGITIICETIRKSSAGRTREHSRFDVKSVSIVNGAQTVATIAEAHQILGLDVAEVKVLARFIQVGSSGDDVLSNDITRSTNTQNGVSGRDFVALDPEQDRIRDELRREDVIYLVKRGDVADNKKPSFDFDSAVVAVACANKNLGLAVRAKRSVSDLWQDTSKGFYKTLFNSSTSGVYTWRCVQSIRIIDKRLSLLQKKLIGKSRGFVVHGNRFIAYCVFQRLGSEFLDGVATLSLIDVSLIEEETEMQVSNMISTAAPDDMAGYPAVFFKNQPEQEALYKRMQKTGMVLKKNKDKSS